MIYSSSVKINETTGGKLCYHFSRKKLQNQKKLQNGKTMKAYLTGKVIPIEEVNDGVFSAKIMGDGIAIIPENEVLTAPADGEITVVRTDLSMQ